MKTWRYLLLLILVVAACAQSSDGSAVATRDSAGVTITENRAPDHPLELTVSRISDLIPPDSALSVVPWGVAADPASGRVYIADWRGTRVAAFDSAGSFVADYGREGDGPGEFRSPAAVAMASDGALVAWDTGRRILSRWSSDGELLGERRPEVAYWGPGFAVGDDRLVTVTSERDPDGMGLHQRLVSRSGRDTEILYELTREQVPMELPCISMPAPRVFAPSITWTGPGDTIYVLDGPAYKIDVYVDDELTRSIRRDVDPIPVTEAMALERVEIGPYASFMRSCGVDAEAIVDAVGHEETLAPVLGIAVDPGGRIWVTRTSDGVHPASVDVFRPDGTYEGTLTGTGMPVAFLSDSLLVSMRAEGTGEQIVSLYELTREAAQR